MISPEHALLGLLQISDSAFPNGGYAYSAGLESILDEPELDLERYLRFRLAEGLARMELPLIREAYAASDDEELKHLERLVDALLPARELRQASRAVGHSILRTALTIQPSQLLNSAVSAHVAHEPIVYGAVVHDWEIPLREAMLAYAWQAVRQQLFVAQRLGRIGQTTVQQLLHRLGACVSDAVDQSTSVGREQIGSYAPWIELASMEHERRFARLFLS